MRDDYRHFSLASRLLSAFKEHRRHSVRNIYNKTVGNVTTLYNNKLFLMTFSIDSEVVDFRIFTLNGKTVN